MSRRIAAAGFTLLEVMLGLALLGFALVMLIKSTTGNMTSAKHAQMMSVVTDLSRGKMYDIEEKLLKEGFTDTDQSEEDRTFEEEGWPEIEYSYKVEQVELPSYDQLQALSAGSGSGGSAGSGSAGSGESNSFQDSALGGMLSMLGGGGGEDVDAKAGASFIQSYYQLVQETLKAAIRKVTLTVKYKLIGDEFELVTVAFFTEPGAMDKTIPFGGAGGDSGSGGGSGGGGGGSGGGSGGSGR